MQYKNLFKSALCAGILSLGLAASRAQTQAIWTGPASGGEWNTAADWSTLLPPGMDVNGTTNAFVGPGTNVSYNLPMSAASFGILTNYGVLNINTNGFNCSAIYVINPAGNDKLFMTNGGTVVTVDGLAMGTNSTALLAGGATLTINGALIVAANESSHASGTSALTNNGGFLSAYSTAVNNGSGTGNGLLVINAGTNNLGNTIVGRSSAGSGGFNALGTEGLVINNGVVTITNLNVGNNASGVSYLTTWITGGLITNWGSVFINQGTSGRASRILQTGGLFVTPDPGVINPNSPASGEISIFSVTGGTNITGGFYFGNSNGAASTVNFTNSASIYIGSQGINWNGAITLNASLNNGGLFGATAPWTGSANMRLVSGTYTFQTADPNGNPNSISLSGALIGAGGLNVTGGGGLTLNAADTYAGNTLITGSRLALGASGSLTSPQIMVGPGSTFDVTALSGAYTLNAGQTLAGLGAVAGGVTAAASSTVYPGSNSLTGTLTLQGGLTETGGANNEFNLSSNPTGPNNDFLDASGGLTLSGTNIITINGALASGGVYPLFGYAGSLTGGVTNLTVTGATGLLSNSATAGIIYFVAQTSVRGPTNITWIGNPLNNNWDTEITTNWLNNGTGMLDFFVPNDNALFSNLGASNSTVNIPGTVSPGSITINTSSNYTFTGVGTIGGIGSLTVSNGTLTILTTNTYTGPTLFDGGVLATPNIAVSGSPSGIGAASSAPGNLIFNGGTFAYTGPSAATDHGMTLTNNGGAIDVTNGSALTLNGLIAGNGTLTVVDSGTLDLANANSYTNTTFINGGVLQLDNAAGAGAGPITFSNGTLVYYPSGGITVANPFNFSPGTVNTIVVTSGSGANPISNGPWTGSGVVVVNDSYNPYTCNGVLDGFTGTILLGTSNGSGFRFNSGGGNTCFGSTNATFDLSTNAAALLCRNAGTMNLGALSGGSGTFLQGQDADSGTVVWAIGYNNLSTTFAGTIENNSANRIASILKLGVGTLTLSGQNTYTGNTTVSNGVLALAFNPTNSADGSIADSVEIDIVAGAILDVSATSTGTLPLNSAQQLRGRGTINGILDTTAGGTVAPGGGPGGNTGTLTVTNNINLGGTAWMKLNRANLPTSDHLVSSLSTVTYGGTLVVTNIGPQLQAGDTFTLFSGGGLANGAFGNIVLPNYYTWNTSNLGVNGQISVTAVLPPPSLTNVDFSALSSGTITLNAINGAPNGPVSVLTTTNLTLPLSSWTTVATGNFDPNGNLNLPITVNPDLPQSYFLLQAN